MAYDFDSLLYERSFADTYLIQSRMMERSTDTKMTFDNGSPLQICAINAETMAMINPAYTHSFMRTGVNGSKSTIAPATLAVTSSILK